jgi:hypothetical protein
VPKFGAADGVIIQFGLNATPNDPSVKLVLDARGCEKPDQRCAARQTVELDERVTEIRKLRDEVIDLATDLKACIAARACTTPGQPDRLDAELAAFNASKVPILLALSDQAVAEGGSLAGKIECEAGEPLSLNRCRNPLENQQAREEAERRRQEEEEERRMRRDPI